MDDEVVQFGSVNTQNFQSLQNIGSVVQHSEGVSQVSRDPRIAWARKH